jgi:Holliday junction resolvase-like predicted endonuclease
MSTHQIYRLAFRLLKRHRRPLAARYSLKQAIVELGPSGHPLEKLVGEILKSQGYQVQVAQVIQGYCVSHEVDVVAERDDHSIMVECKLHHQRGLKVDVKVALYIQERCEDVARAWQLKDGSELKFHQAWLVTNAKLTSDAIRYGECVGLKVIGWEHPHGGSLPVLIEQSGLHPVTALTGLSRAHKKQLVDKGIILCSELKPGDLRHLGLTERKAAAIMKELEELCQQK